MNKVGGIYQLGRSLMRVTYILLQETEFGGIPKAVEKVSLLWEPAAVLKQHHALEIGGLLVWGCLFVLVSDLLDWIGRRRR